MNSTELSAKTENNFISYVCTYLLFGSHTALSPFLLSCRDKEGLVRPWALVGAEEAVGSAGGLVAG